MAQKAAATIVGPTWALEEEYPGLASDRLKKDLSFVENETATLEASSLRVIVRVGALIWRGRFRGRLTNPFSAFLRRYALASTSPSQRPTRSTCLWCVTTPASLQEPLGVMLVRLVHVLRPASHYFHACRAVVSCRLCRKRGARWRRLFETSQFMRTASSASTATTRRGSRRVEAWQSQQPRVRAVGSVPEEFYCGQPPPPQLPAATGRGHGCPSPCAQGVTAATPSSPPRPASRAQIAATCRRLGSKLSQALTSHSLVLKLCPDELAEKYLAEIPHERFRVKHARKLRNFVLPPGCARSAAGRARSPSLHPHLQAISDNPRAFPAVRREESLLTALTVDGFTSWGQLYTTLSSSAQCTVNGTQMGVAKAAGLLSSADRAERRAAWEAIQAAWRVHEEAARNLPHLFA